MTVAFGWETSPDSPGPVLVHRVSVPFVLALTHETAAVYSRRIMGVTVFEREPTSEAVRAFPGLTTRSNRATQRGVEAVGKA